MVWPGDRLSRNFFPWAICPPFPGWEPRRVRARRILHLRRKGWLKARPLSHLCWARASWLCNPAPFQSWGFSFPGSHSSVLESSQRQSPAHEALTPAAGRGRLNPQSPGRRSSTRKRSAPGLTKDNRNRSPWPLPETAGERVPDRWQAW